MTDNEVDAPIQNHRRRRTPVRGRRGRLLVALLAAAMAGVLALTFTIGSAGAQSGDSIGVTEQQQTNVGQDLARDHHDEATRAHHEGDTRVHHDEAIWAHHEGDTRVHHDEATRAHHEGDTRVHHDGAIWAHHEGDTRVHHDGAIWAHHEGDTRVHHDGAIWAHHEGEPRDHHEDCDHHGGKFGHRVAVNAVAELLGLEPEALSDRMVDGETLADIAAAQGVEVSDLVDAIVAAISEHAAEHGHEIDTEALTEKVTAVVNDAHPERPEGKDGWKARRGLHRWGGHIGSHSSLSTA